MPTKTSEKCRQGSKPPVENATARYGESGDGCLSRYSDRGHCLSHLAVSLVE